MKIRILEQGYTGSSPNSAGRKIIKFLKSKKYEKFTAISAFASKAGILGIKPYMKKFQKDGGDVAIIVGIDQMGTSKAALNSINKLKVNSYVFFQRASPIFHPKIYLFEGKSKSQLIVGSSNLTAQGLFSNIETSILLTLDNSVQDDIDLVNELKDRFKGLFDLTDPNLQQINKTLIKNLVKSGRIPTEKQRRKIHQKSNKNIKPDKGNILKTLFPSRKISPIPSGFKSKKKTKTSQSPKSPPQAVATPPASVPSSNRGAIAWSRSSLPASSVQASPGGNPTGGLRLVQAKFKVGGAVIDQTTYFRNTVFGNLSWRTVEKSEIATAQFTISILGTTIGTFDLEVRHKPSGEAGQGNYTTLISWGAIGDTIKQANLTGKLLNLYYPSFPDNPFIIEIL